MPEFLELIPPKAALERLLTNLPVRNLCTETIATSFSMGRVLTTDISSPEPLPAFTRSTVDGYAVRARDTHGASESMPTYLEVIGEVPMGAAPSMTVGAGQAAIIHTGGMLPDGADAVVMLEYTQIVHSTEVECFRSIPTGENLLRIGEDVQVGDTVVPAGKRLTPADMGGLSALGIVQVPVYAKPVIGIMSSGDEVIPVEKKPLSGQVRDINATTLTALIEKSGGTVINYGIVPDRQTDMEEVLSSILNKCDAAVITAGSSASSRDFTAAAIAKMGTPGVLVHGVNVKPGKPTILGVCNGKAVVGLPGNPVSALVIAWLFVVPLVRKLSGEIGTLPASTTRARISVNVASIAGREDYIPVRLEQVDGSWHATPTFFKSNLIFTLASADGLVRIEPDATGLHAGSDVEVLTI